MAPPPDPSLAIQANQAANANNAATQDTAGIDTASLMARYGTRLALGGNIAGLPVAAAAAPTAPAVAPLAALIPLFQQQPSNSDAGGMGGFG